MSNSSFRGNISAFIPFVTAVVVTGKVHPVSITASVSVLFPPCNFDHALDFIMELDFFFGESSSDDSLSDSSLLSLLDSLISTAAFLLVFFFFYLWLS